MAFASPNPQALLDHSAKEWQQIKAVHENSRTSDVEPMLNTTRAMLDEFLAPHNAALERLLGRSMEW